MSYWGGATAGGWSHSHFPTGSKPGSALKRSVDGWDDDELGKLYDHSVAPATRKYVKGFKPMPYTADARLWQVWLDK